YSKGALRSCLILIQLTELSLQQNNLMGAFEGLVNLRTVEISNNPLTSISVGTFQDEIALQGNKINELPPNLFPHKGKLSKLSLENNLLTSLPDKYFVGFMKLKTLTLKNNHLTSLPPVLFGEMPRLTELSLQQNNLNVFESLVKLKKLDLSHNPWNCDCHLIDFYQWMKSKSSILSTEVTCEYPEHLKGTEIISLPEDQFICPTPTPTTTKPTTTPLTTTTLPTTTLTTTQLTHQKYLKYYLPDPSPNGFI
uniref:LRRCT domain-containing protein n=1 Tax=Kryptolebias marmoratus TaxID=37003 RepID=A0A3Q3BSF9_KRYMA